MSRHTSIRPTLQSKAIDWDSVYDQVYQLYWVDNRTLEDTMRVMRRQHSFSATKQWISKLADWNLKKNISTEEMENIVRIQRKRKMQDDKDTHFTVRGRTVAQDNIDRWEKRQKKNTSEDAAVPASPQALSITTPSDILYETPSDMASSPPHSVASTPRASGEQASKKRHESAAVPAVALFATEIPLPLPAENDETAYRTLSPEEAAMEVESPFSSRLGDRHPADETDSDSVLDGLGFIVTDPDEISISEGSSTPVAATTEKGAVPACQTAAMAQPESEQEKKDRELRAAAQAGNAALVGQLIDAGANIESRSESGMSALHVAAFYGRFDVVGLLIVQGADVRAPVAHGEVEIPFKVPVRLKDPRPIHLAASRGHTAVANLLWSVTMFPPV
ncbi:hypothetical protein B0H67DRAFT_387561 [Lasiosphaeris hirsuta]|uniref:Clr5 domain-containing protein n=1 Tax=Lasiosphaeris hirsuta TaxID=260670 RepID=A0AA39ZXR5_9PEZI|nr:hypothetical protein B0H67DRAFT_387561 [Lasiosphaeris hirsuta]